MCEYCKEGKDLSQSAYLTINKDKLFLRHSFKETILDTLPVDGYSEEIKINYCPICGNSLEKSSLDVLIAHYST